LTRLLHEFFTNEKTKISKDADRAVGKYMETFVKEAIARAVYERQGVEGGNAVGEGFLEVCYGKMNGT
jgi:centromere protein X